MTFENLLTELRGANTVKTALITLHRPKQLNALNDALMDELGVALKAFDADESIGCMVITGSERARRQLQIGDSEQRRQRIIELIRDTVQ